MRGKSIRARGLLLTVVMALTPAFGSVAASASEDSLTITRQWKCPIALWYCRGQQVHGVARLQLIDGVPHLDCQAWAVRPFWWYGTGVPTPTWNASLTCYAEFIAEDGTEYYMEEAYETNHPYNDAGGLWLPTTGYYDVASKSPADGSLPHLCFSVGGYYSTGDWIERGEGATACGNIGDPDSINANDFIPNLNDRILPW